MNDCLEPGLYWSSSFCFDLMVNLCFFVVMCSRPISTIAWSSWNTRRVSCTRIRQLFLHRPTWISAKSPTVLERQWFWCKFTYINREEIVGTNLCIWLWLLCQNNWCNWIFNVEKWMEVSAKILQSRLFWHLQHFHHVHKETPAFGSLACGLDRTKAPLQLVPTKEVTTKNWRESRARTLENLDLASNLQKH